MQRQVKIGPRFFAQAKADYADWHWAWVREICQNSMDCGSSEISFDVRLNDDGNTVVTVENDGDVMTESVLCDKLLSLGESGKEFEDTTGGFGKAKEVLVFTHLSWSIHSGALLADGCGGDYELDADADWFDGTRTTVVMEGDVVDELEAQFMTFTKFGQWSGRFYWNGVLYKAAMKKGSRRRDLGFGIVYTNKSEEYKLVVRMNGQPMFVQDISFDRCVVLELAGNSGDVLTSNRDGLRSTYRWDLSDFITELSVDKRSALKASQPKYRHYDGTRLCHRAVAEHEQTTKVSDILAIAPAPVLTEQPEFEPTQVIDEGETEYDLVGAGDAPEYTGEYHEAEVRRPTRAAAYSSEPMQPVEEVRVSIGEEFVIKNETDLAVPSYYCPDKDDFSTYSRKLARIWGRLMLQCHRLFDHEAEFAIGFIFPEDTTEAEFEKGQYGKVYYIAPAKLVQQRSSQSQSWRKNFKLTERNRMLALAVHEFAHGLGYMAHDEDYANKFTDLMIKVLDNRKDFNWCWQ